MVCSAADWLRCDEYNLRLELEIYPESHPESHPSAAFLFWRMDGFSDVINPDDFPDDFPDEFLTLVG